MKKILFASLALLTGLSLSVFAQDAATAKLEKTEAVVAKNISVPDTAGLSRIFIVGDSTASPFNDPYYIPRYGFGTKLQDYLDSSKAAVVNLAVSGRSSISFISDSGSAVNYDLLKKNIRKGDYLIIAFGHNDEKLETERYTDPNMGKDDAGSFQNSLYYNYIKLAQDAGATPVLATPIVRYNKSGEYTGSVVHITKGDEKFPGGDYPEAIRDLGKEVNVLVVDQTENTKALYEQLGEDATKLHAMTGSKEASLDSTHLNAYGAAVVAKMLAEGIAAKDATFKGFLVANLPEPTYSLDALKNPSYIEPGFGAPTEKSSIFTTKEPWWGSAFGNIGGSGKAADKNLFEIIETENGVTMHSGEKNGGKDSGKIASSEDGILFYFQKLPIDKDFTLKATAKVLNIKSNNQVSFGLMARDNVIIDDSIAGMNSNYVAAAPLKIKNAGWSAGFARIDSVLNENEHVVESVPAKDTVVNLSIVKKGEEFTVTYGKEEPVTYTVNLGEYDKDNMYVGTFTSRNAYVEFTNLSLSYPGAASAGGSSALPVAIIVLILALAAAVVCVILKKKKNA
ncbi:MAG: hypothetical protein IJ207_03075 [Treponema sp.]|uniref:SGNH/GDSL hydrolase family protein n=1 Tax=Treponema sp. TaxID=166 RepID=UPI0025EFEFC1|nr:SGNH/GDSL hydrolase family protein [Treponema sp.]MBQ9281162.1 hypothetical protein [Treponema sp.]